MEFIESPAFTRRLHQLAGDSADDVLSAIQQDLLEKPDRGVMVPGLGGVRKARIANPGRGKGKRGGYRYLYLYLEMRQHTHLLIFCSTRTNRKTPPKINGGKCGNGSLG